jgi:hypothetical protein
MDEKEDVRVTLRLPADLYEDIAKFARGSNRPKASINATLVFLLRVGLAQQLRLQAKQEQDDPGVRTPSLIASARRV